MQIEILITGKDLLFTRMGSKAFQVVYANSHHSLNIKDGSNQVDFRKASSHGRVAHWQMILTEYDIQYTTQKTIKGIILEDYLAQ